MFELDADKVYERLKDTGVNHLYHANTVRTSCSFLREGHLLSRGTLEDLNLDQTPQYTDEDDKDFNIWYDIFLDTVDIQEHLNRANLYGPVLFAFDIEVLLEDHITAVWITASNPANWRENDTQYKERWLNQNQMENEYHPLSKGAFGNHIVLRNIGGVLSFNPHLQSVIVDDPDRDWPDYQGFDLLSMAAGALLNAAQAGGVSISPGDVTIRDCYHLYEDTSDDKIVRGFAPYDPSYGAV